MTILKMKGGPSWMTTCYEKKHESSLDDHLDSKNRSKAPLCCQRPLKLVENEFGSSYHGVLFHACHDRGTRSSRRVVYGSFPLAGVSGRWSSCEELIGFFRRRSVDHG